MHFRDAGYPLADPHDICDAIPERVDSIDLDEQCVHMNTYRMSITPKAIQDLVDELEASKQSRLRAWKALQRLRSQSSLPNPL
jgi:hypothetical protein